MAQANGSPSLDRGNNWPGLAGVRRLDAASLAGLLGACGVVIALSFGGQATAAFLDPRTLLFVFGGTAAALALSCTAHQLTSAFKAMPLIFASRDMDLTQETHRLLRLAVKARRNGFGILEETLEQFRPSPFLRHGLSLVLSGLSPKQVEQVLVRNSQTQSSSLSAGAEAFETVARIAPLMGVVGSIWAIIQVFGTPTEFPHLGSGAAMALLPVLYGLAFAQLFCAPLATKLRKRAQEQVLFQRIYTAAAVSIAAKDNPRNLEAEINALLPEGWRTNHFD